jgi:hypothetical protein
MRIIALAAGLLIAAIAPAKADWAYTKWGMSLDQIVTASKGAVKILPKAEQGTPRPDTKEYVAAAGNYTDGKTPLQVKFMIDRQRRVDLRLLRTCRPEGQFGFGNAHGQTLWPLAGAFRPRLEQPGLHRRNGAARWPQCREPLQEEMSAGAGIGARPIFSAQVRPRPSRS